MARRTPMTERLIVRVTPADRQLVTAAAATRGEVLSDWLREAIRDRARKDLVAPEERAEG